MPCRIAMSANSVWLATASFCLMLYRWVPAVRGEILSISATWLTLMPRASSMKTANSRSDSTHLYNIKQKLAVANQTELALIAMRHGMIAP